MQTPMHLYRTGTGEHFLRQDDGGYLPVTSVADEDVRPVTEQAAVPFPELSQGQRLELVDPNVAPPEPVLEGYDDWQPPQGRVRWEAVKVGDGLRIVES